MFGWTYFEYIAQPQWVIEFIIEEYNISTEVKNSKIRDQQHDLKELKSKKDKTYG